MSHTESKARRVKSTASAPLRIGRSIASSLRALRLEAQLSLKMWCEPLLRLVLKPRTTTILDSADWAGQFPPLSTLRKDLHSLRVAQSRTPLSAETRRQLAAQARRASGETNPLTPRP